MCRFQRIEDCPLYIASHDAGGLGCVDDMASPCMVERGKLDFQTACWRLVQAKRDYPGLLQIVETAGAA